MKAGWWVGLAFVIGVGGLIFGLIENHPVSPSTLKIAPRRHRSRSTRPAFALSPAHPKTPTVQPAVPMPTNQKPLTILCIGDSLGEDLQYGLADLMGSNPAVHIVEAAVGSTGLANVAYYNWPLALSQELARYHPQIVVVLLGGNDAVSFDQGPQYVPFGSPLWQADYGDRVARMMAEARQAGAYVVWVGLPVMASFSVLSNTAMQALNAVYQDQARLHPGVVYVSSWTLFKNADGQFTEYLPDPAGQSLMVRDPDGVHIAPPAGNELIASLVIQQINQHFGLSLCVSGQDPWQNFHLARCPTVP